MTWWLIYVFVYLPIVLAIRTVEFVLLSIITLVQWCFEKAPGAGSSQSLGGPR